MKRKATARNKDVDLLEVQDAFEELGRDSPSLTAKEAVEKLGPAKGLTGADGKPKNKTTQNFMKLCLQAFRRAQRSARMNQPAKTKIARRLKMRSHA